MSPVRHLPLVGNRLVAAQAKKVKAMMATIQHGKCHRLRTANFKRRKERKAVSSPKTSWAKKVIQMAIVVSIWSYIGRLRAYLGRLIARCVRTPQSEWTMSS